MTYDEVHQDPDAALATIVARYHEVERKCDAVVIVGTDYTDLAAAAEFEYNARIAANLGSPVALVVRGTDRTPSDIAQSVESSRLELEGSHARLAAVFVNKCDPERVTEVCTALPRDLCMGVLPEDPVLVAPLLSELLTAVDGTLYSGDENLLTREVLGVTIGAMTVDHLLDRLEEGRVVITPGDRADALLGILAAHRAKGFPTIAGIIINGGFHPTKAMRRLLKGMNSSLPIIATDLGTFEAATRCWNTRGRLSRDSSLKVDTARALFDKFVDDEALRRIFNVASTDVVTPLMFEYALLDRARSERQHIVLPEGDDDRVLRAASTLLRRGVVDLTILGNETPVRARAAELGLDIGDATVLSPTNEEYVERFAAHYAEIRASKGVTLDMAREIVTDVSYFGTMMVLDNLADGMVSGAAHTTAHTITPAFQVIKTPPGVGIVSSVFLMCLQDRVLVYGDCAVNPDPTADQLADIAISSAETAAQFHIEPRVAMLSYSTGSSGSGTDVEKVREATELVRSRKPDLLVEGPIQYDAAIDPTVASAKAPNSAGRGSRDRLRVPRPQHR